MRQQCACCVLRPLAPAARCALTRTTLLSVDLASPLVAYKVASLVFNQEVPVWLDVIIYGAAAAATYIVLSGNTSLDAYLQ